MGDFSAKIVHGLEVFCIWKLLLGGFLGDLRVCGVFQKTRSGLSVNCLGVFWEPAACYSALWCTPVPADVINIGMYTDTYTGIHHKTQYKCFKKEPNISETKPVRQEHMTEAAVLLAVPVVVIDVHVDTSR